MPTTLHIASGPRTRRLQIAFLVSFVGFGVFVTAAWTGWLIGEAVDLVSSFVG